MNHEDQQFRQYLETLRQQLVARQNEPAANWEALAAALEGLELAYEELQTQLKATAAVEEQLIEQNQQISANYHYYYDLFQTAPIPYLLTDANGLILDANQAIAQLLHVPRSYLLGKPLAVFVLMADRLNFRRWLNQLARSRNRSVGQVHLCPRQGEPFLAELTVAINRYKSDLIKTLQIGVYNLSQSQSFVLSPIQHLQPPQISETANQAADQAATASSLPSALDGLQVLIVDDEADAREFITAVLEARGIRVMAVASAAAALEALEHFRPDALVSDIRMPDEDGYSLIRRVRALEAATGWHIPAAALTAYLSEDREKALAAGYESHLHKLAHPSELIELVAQLAKRAL